MHTLARRTIFDKLPFPPSVGRFGGYLNELFLQLDSGRVRMVDRTAQYMLPAFNAYKAAGGKQWEDIQTHCQGNGEAEPGQERGTFVRDFEDY